MACTYDSRPASSRPSRGRQPRWFASSFVFRAETVATSVRRSLHRRRHLCAVSTTCLRHVLDVIFRIFNQYSAVQYNDDGGLLKQASRRQRRRSKSDKQQQPATRTHPLLRSLEYSSATQIHKGPTHNNDTRDKQTKPNHVVVGSTSTRGNNGRRTTATRHSGYGSTGRQVGRRTDGTDSTAVFGNRRRRIGERNSAPRVETLRRSGDFTSRFGGIRRIHERRRRRRPKTRSGNRQMGTAVRNRIYRYVSCTATRGMQQKS